MFYGDKLSAWILEASQMSGVATPQTTYRHNHIAIRKIRSDLLSEEGRKSLTHAVCAYHEAKHHVFGVAA